MGRVRGPACLQVLEEPAGAGKDRLWSASEKGPQGHGAEAGQAEAGGMLRRPGGPCGDLGSRAEAWGSVRRPLVPGCLGARLGH